MSHYFVFHVGEVREHIVALVVALPDLPYAFERVVDRLQAEGPRRRTVVLLVLVFAGLGFGVEWLFRTATQKTRRRLDGLPMETVNDRLRLVAARFAGSFGIVAAFAIGSVGPFLALDRPPLLSEMVFGYLVAFVVTRIAVVVGHFLLAPDAERFRIIPTDRMAARFWCRRITAFVGWLAFVWVTVGLLSWGIDLIHIAGRDTPFARLVHGALSVVIILLIADLVWAATKAAIDRKLADSADLGLPNTDEARRRAQLRTLLPIFRNIQKAFDANGGKFAFPTVQIAGDGDPAAATAGVAHRALEMTHPAAA